MWMTSDSHDTKSTNLMQIKQIIKVLEDNKINQVLLFLDTGSPFSKRAAFVFDPFAVQSMSVQGCLMATLHIIMVLLKFHELNFLFSAASFEAIVQIASEILILF